MELTDEALSYHGQLEVGLDWWMSRGFEKRTLDHFRVGWIADPQSKNAASHIHKPTIPYLTTKGKVIWLRVRGGGKAKYLPIGRDFPLSQPKCHLFNAQQAIPTTTSRRVYVVEGELDAMSIWQLGGKAVGVPGATNWQKHWGQLLRDAEVVLCFDGDEAGQFGADAVERALRDLRVEVTRIPLSEGMDINDILMSHSKQEAQELLDIPG